MAVATLKNNTFAKISSRFRRTTNLIYHPIMRESGGELNYTFDYELSNHLKIHN